MKREKLDFPPGRQEATIISWRWSGRVEFWLLATCLGLALQEPGLGIFLSAERGKHVGGGHSGESERAA
jgi:hypothetical protein